MGTRPNRKYSLMETSGSELDSDSESDTGGFELFGDEDDQHISEKGSENLSPLSNYLD